MGRACSSCGAMAAPEARFCRLCGAPLRFPEADNGSVSPLAQTVPLSGEGRHTDGFTPGDQKRSAETSRVRREEIERLLHRAPAETPADETADGPIIIPVPQDFVAPTTSELAPTPSSVAEQAEPVSVASSATEPRAGRSWRPFIIIAALCTLLLISAGAAVFFWSRLYAEQKAQTGPEIPNGEAQGSVEAQLSEAQSLLASGQTSAALAQLRGLVQREPSNAAAHRLLGEALLRGGERAEAIKEYEAATRLDAKDAVSWHALAAAQFAEKLYADAVESYRRLIALTGEDALDDNARLEYADALRLAGYTEDARAVYQRIQQSAPADLASQATKHLSELTPSARGPQASNINSNSEQALRADEANARQMTELARNRASESPAPQPHAPTSASPASSSNSPATSAASNASGPSKTANKNAVAQTDPDAYYFQALSILNGREPKDLPRAELLRALQLFQNAAVVKGGAHREQAQKYAERLGREYDRRPRQK